MIDRDTARHRLAAHLARLGIHDPAVLQAVREVPREAFLPPELEEFAYDDTALPIGEGQTISQPFVVALMAQEARLRSDSRVLEVGTGSGYAAAIFSRIAAAVHTIERHASLATLARERLEVLGYDNVHVRHGDGTLGWPEAAPFDAILVAAGGPELPTSLKEQLAPGGRLVIPVGETQREQRLVCVQRTDGKFERTDLGAVRFVPLVGQEGWAGERGGRIAPTVPASRRARLAAPEPRGPVALLRDVAEPIPEIGSVDLGSLAERIGDARVVLLGEATHGTSEFYRMRARITRDLIERHGFNLVTIEGDWPDAAQVHRWTRGLSPDGDHAPFARFPTWMWRNRETDDFVTWLRDWNARAGPERQVGFHGLDLYSMYAPQGQTNVGALARDWLGDAAFNVGFGTDRGTVAATGDWGGPLEIKVLRPARPDSYEALCNATRTPAFLVHLREPEREEVRDELAGPHLERAVGVIYRPDTELQSHYFHASLPHQFDAWIWFDETEAVEPLGAARRATRGAPAFPFGA